MIAALCAALSGLAYFASTGLGVIWPLAWLAPAPVLWLAFGHTGTRTVAIASFAAFLILARRWMEKIPTAGFPNRN